MSPERSGPSPSGSPKTSATKPAKAARELATTVLTTTDPDALNAMEDALTRAGRLTVTYGWRDRDDATGIWQPGLDLPTTRLHAGDQPVMALHVGTWREVTP